MMPATRPPTRSEVRLIGLAFEAKTQLSAALVRLIELARVGWLDGQTLFDQLVRLGMGPVWLQSSASPSIHIVDPLAGQVVLRCETATVTLH